MVSWCPPCLKASITIHVRRPIGANLDTFRAAVIDVKNGEKKEKEERKKRRERSAPFIRKKEKAHISNAAGTWYLKDEGKDLFQSWWQHQAHMR